MPKDIIEILKSVAISCKLYDKIDQNCANLYKLVDCESLLNILRRVSGKKHSMVCAERVLSFDPSADGLHLLQGGGEVFPTSMLL